MPATCRVLQLHCCSAIIVLGHLATPTAVLSGMSDNTAEGVDEFLFSCFLRHGCYNVKITDQGQAFVNQVASRLFIFTCRAWYIKVCFLHGHVK